MNVPPRVGEKIILQKHTTIKSNISRFSDGLNWTSEMDQYIGKEATISDHPWGRLEDQGLTVRVGGGASEWGWRIHQMERPELEKPLTLEEMRNLVREIANLDSGQERIEITLPVQKAIQEELLATRTEIPPIQTSVAINKEASLTNLKKRIAPIIEKEIKAFLNEYASNPLVSDKTKLYLTSDKVEQEEINLPEPLSLHEVNTLLYRLLPLRPFARLNFRPAALELKAFKLGLLNGMLSSEENWISNLDVETAIEKVQAEHNRLIRSTGENAIEKQKETREERKKSESKMNKKSAFRAITQEIENHDVIEWPWVSPKEICERINPHGNEDDHFLMKEIDRMIQDRQLLADPDGQIKVEASRNLPLFRSTRRPVTEAEEVTPEETRPETTTKEPEETKEDEVKEEVEEEKRGIMSKATDVMAGAAKATGRDAAASMRRGAEMATAKEFTDGVVTIAKETLPEDMALLLETDIGKKLAPLMVSMMTNYAAHAMPGKIPHAGAVQKYSASAMDACFYEGFGELTHHMQPFFQRVGQMAASLTLGEQEAAASVSPITPSTVPTTAEEALEEIKAG